MIPVVDVSEQLQTVAIWKADVVDGSKERFVDHLRNAATENNRSTIG